MLRATTVFLICAAAHAATTTVTVNATVTIGTSAVAATGPATLTGGIAASGTFSASVPITALSGSTATGTFTITFSGGTLTGTLQLPVAVLEGSTTSGSGTMTITGGTGTYSGDSGTIPVTGSGTLGASGITITFTGSGTIATGGTTGPQTPVIGVVENNYLPASFPASVVTPGMLVKVEGTGLADPNAPLVLQTTVSPGLPKQLGGTSLTITYGSTTTGLAIYYAGQGSGGYATQIDTVIPAATPAGSATITVTYNGTPSAPFTVQVVPAALSIATYGSGPNNGLAQATNPFTGAYYTTTNSIKPGDTITLWGSGLGAITGDSDNVYTAAGHSATVPLQVFIGGYQAAVLYWGGSGYPGLNQMNVTVPTTVLPGCNVSVGAISGSGANLIASPQAGLSIAANGGACSDSTFSIDGNTLTTLSGKSTVKSGFAILVHSVQGSATNDYAQTSFQSQPGSNYAGGNNLASLGSCTVTQGLTGSVTPNPSTGLNAGTITVSGPNGSATLSQLSSLTPGVSSALLASGFIPSTGGSFKFNWTGGADVGSGNVTLVFPNPPLTWTNQPALATITRANGATFTWTGGAAGSFVEITGTSTNNTTGLTGSYFCYAPVAAGTFTVPQPVLLNLPSGTGNIALQNIMIQTFTAPSLDFGLVIGGVSYGSGNVTYN